MKTLKSLVIVGVFAFSVCAPSISYTEEGGKPNIIPNDKTQEQDREKDKKKGATPATPATPADPTPGTPGAIPATPAIPAIPPEKPVCP